MAICSLLLHPNPEKPASQEVANIYISDQEQFTKTAAEWTKLHAPPDVWHPAPPPHEVRQPAPHEIWQL